MEIVNFFMSDLFHQKSKNNYYDNLIVDLNDIYSKSPINKKHYLKTNQVSYLKSYFDKLYHCSILPLKVRVFFWHLLRQTRIDLTWFKEFKNYWTSVIGGRPLWNVEDLFFLKNLYRVKFQECQIPDTNDPEIHLKTWQLPELIYQLLHLVCKESINNEYGILKLLMTYKKKFRSLLEFGCGTAPITTTLFELFHLSKKIKIFLSDIQTLAFNYAAYKFRNCLNVIPVILDVENDFLLNLNEKVDVITCIAVFEHLNRPLETIKIFYETLNHNGLLFFDYIKSIGEGLDTKQAVRERDSVLEFINENFEVIHGRVTKDKNMGLAIAKKL